MASSNLELSKFGGRVNTDTGMLLTSTDVDRVGDIGLKTLLNFLALACFDGDRGLPLSGFPRDELTTDHCRVSSTSDLGYSVSTGWGVFFDSTAVGDDEFAPTAYRPIVVSSPLTGTLDPHDSNPRIDIVCLGPAWVDDQGASRNVKDPGTGVITSNSVNQRRRFGASIVVVKGTAAASPSAPAVPAGYLEVGRAYVPATAGAASWEDTRAVLTFGHHFRGLPRYAVSDFVPLGGSTELQVAATAPASMAVEVNRGRAVIGGICRSYSSRKLGSKLTIAAADPSQTRYDLVVAASDGTISVVTGTPGGSVPALPANSLPLASIEVGAAVTTIPSGKITDLRDREPFDGTTMIQSRSIQNDRMARPMLNVTIDSIADGNVDTATVTLSVTDYDGNTLPDGLVGTLGPYMTIEVQIVYAGPSNTAITPGTYGFGGGGDYRAMLNDSPVPFLIVPGTNMDFGIAYSGAEAMLGRAWLKVVDPTSPTCTFTVRREDNTSNLNPTIIVRPVEFAGNGDVSKIDFT